MTADGNSGVVPTPSADAPPPGEPWTVLRMILWSAEYLTTKGVERGRLDAEYLLAATLGLDRLQLYLQFDRPLKSDELAAYRPSLKRRAAREPLQYVLGTAAFRDVELVVDSRVLIPRPETEGLVEQVVAWAAQRPNARLSALDVGTGSGAIAIALLSEGICDRCVAIDASAAAIEVADMNATTIGVDLETRLGSFFEPVGDQESFDIVVSNPPYVLDHERDEMAPEVRDHEPARALFAGSDGLDAIRVILAGAARVVTPGGLLALEIGAGQGSAVMRLAEQLSGFRDARLYQDLSSRDRYVTMTRTAGG